MSNNDQSSDSKAPEKRTTLLRPPEPDPSKAPIENTVEITALDVLGPDIFTNTRQPWLPIGARGIFGGSVIAQCLAAAQRTVPDDFLVHSCHCYFLLAGTNTIPIMYHVERVRDGRSFATRTVQARQKGSCIFTTTISFAREGSGGKHHVQHAASLPEGLVMPSDGWDEEEPWWARTGPYQSRKVEVMRVHDTTARPDERKVRQWIRARGKISEEGGHQAHLNALAYMSDSDFMWTVARIHRLWKYAFPPDEITSLPEDRQLQIRALAQYEGLGTKLEEWAERPRVGMLVSLDHSIYFHEPKRVKADEWMFTEMESPWSGDGRGVVMSRIFAKDGTLLVSCIQEGVIRLQPGEGEKPKL